MMDEVMTATTKEMTLAQVVDQLRDNPAVRAVLQIGSLSREALTPHSDYDLVIVLVDAIRPWYVGVTTIDHRLTDLIFVDATAVRDLLDLEPPLEAHHPAAPLVRWLREGQILYAADSGPATVQTAVQEQTWLSAPGEDAAYDAWFSLNYNLAQLKRMAAAEEGVYPQVVPVRMAVYGSRDLWFGYFAMRQLPWTGDKAAVRYLEAHDPAFWTAFQAFINRPSVEAYERAAVLAAAPLGGVWPPDTAVMNVRGTGEVWRKLIEIE